MWKRRHRSVAAASAAPGAQSTTERSPPALGAASALYCPRVECVTCKKNDDDPEIYVRINKCPICFKLVCEQCAVNAFGRFFCSKRCSDQFFFGDDDE